MKTRLKILLLILMCAASTYAHDLDSMHKAANDAYANQQYQEAAAMYVSILQNKPSAETNYNLGNAYYKMGKIPESILYYERALMINPTDPDIIHNLELANSQVIDKIEAVPKLFFITFWENMVGSCSSCLWSKVAVALIWMALLAFAFSFFVSRPLFRKTALVKGITFTLLSIFAFLFANTQQSVESEEKYGILFSQTAYIKSAPNKAGVDLFILHEGVKMHIVEEVDDWYKIKLADGKEGWLLKSAIELV